MVQCCAYSCTNTGTHRFPKELALRRRWQSLVSRKNFVATSASRLCGAHFREEDYSVEGFVGGLKYHRKTLKKGAVPSVFSWKKELTVTEKTLMRSERLMKRECKRNLFNASTEGVKSNVNADNVCDEAEPDSDIQYECDEPETDADIEYVCEMMGDLGYVEEEVGSPGVESCPTVESEPTSNDAEPVQRHVHYLSFSANSFRNDHKGIHFYTGLESYDKFKLVFNTLWPEAASLKYYEDISIEPEDAFLLTLMKLRCNKTLYELGRFFGVSIRQASNVFLTWIQFMHAMWSLLDVWPSRELVDFFMPEGFKAAYPSTRVIVDGTEIPIEKPKHPAAQQASFSQYKNRNTVKIEIGGSPAGLLSHWSDAYGGSASDRQIVERSGLIQKCEKGDSVMADRGFNVQDLFAPHDVSVNIPHFLKGKSQLPGLTVLKDRKLSSKRVHIERLIGLLKTYKIFTHPLNAAYLPVASKIVGVCCMLCNFREGIVGEQA